VSAAVSTPAPAASRANVVDVEPRRRGRPLSEIVRKNVLRAAIELLEERDFKSLTIEAIAERAGASKVTLYRRWPNKAAIVMEAFLADVAPRVPFRHSGSALEDLRTQMIMLVRLLRGPRGRWIAGLIAEGVLDAEVNEALRTRWLVHRRAEGLKVVQRAIEQGELAPDVDPDVVLDALYGPIYFRLLLGHRPIDARFATSVWETATRGFRVREPKRARP
jgi:AcrR family transcriptional regulator